MPEPFRTELPAGAGFVEVKVSVAPGRILISQQAQLNAAVIFPADYDKLLALNDRLTAPAAKAVLLRKK